MCKKCKDTGVIKYKPLDGFSHYQWVKWYTKPCDCKGKKNGTNKKN